MTTIFSLMSPMVRVGFTVLVGGLFLLHGLPVHADDVQCELIENSRVNPRIITHMLEAADEGYLYRVDSRRSRIGFQVSRFPFSRVEGAFHRFDGGLTLPEGDKPLRQALFLVKANSMVTGDDKLDDYLKSATFFNATQFPDIIFVSTGFEWSGGSSAKWYAICQTSRNTFLIDNSPTLYILTDCLMKYFHYNVLYEI